MSNYTAVLDANVLVDACLRDTLLRMAEEPRLYRPRWSELIIDELKGVLRLTLPPLPVEGSG